MGEIRINIKDNGNTEFETVGDLIKQLESERQWYIKNNNLDEFLNSKVELQLSDINGQILFGKSTLIVGMCGERFIIAGNIDDCIIEEELR